MDFNLPAILNNDSCPSLQQLLTSTTTEDLETSRKRSHDLFEVSPLQQRKRQRKSPQDAHASIISKALPSPEDRTQSTVPSYDNFYMNYQQLSPISQSLFLFELVKNSHRQTLQLVSSIVIPALKQDFISNLPREVAHLILVGLDVNSLCNACLVSKKWKQIVDDDSLLWRKFLLAEGWDDRTMRDVALLDMAGSTLIDQNISAEAKRYKALSEVDLQSISPCHIPSFDLLRNDPFILMPTLSQTFTQSSASFPHIYKLLFAHYFIMRKNWFTGNCKSKSFQAHENRVITNLIIDSQNIITGSDANIIYILDIQTGEIKRKLDGHEGGVWCLDICGPRRNTIISGSTDRTVRVWDLDSGSCLQVLRGHSSTIRCLSVVSAPIFGNGIMAGPSSPQSIESERPFWVITGARDATVRVWQIYPASQQETSHISSEELDNTIALQESFPENHQESAHRQLNVENHNNQDEEFDLDSVEDEELIGETPLIDSPESSTGFLFGLVGHEGSVRAMSAHDDIAITASYDHTLRVWDLAREKCLFRLTGHTNKIYSLAYDWKNKIAISGSMDTTVRVWDIKTGECLNVFEEHSGLVGLIQLDYLSFLPKAPHHKYSENTVNKNEDRRLIHGRSIDGKSYTRHPILVTAAADGVIKVWDPTRSKSLHTFYGHKSAITCFQFDNDKLVSGGEGSIKIWDMKEGLFVRDIVSNISGAWKLAINERYCVCAVQRNAETWFEMMDFGIPIPHEQ